MSGFISDRFQGPQNFNGLNTTCSIITCSFSRIPGIEMSAHRNILIRKFRTPPFTDHIISDRIRKSMRIGGNKKFQIFL